MNAVNVRSKFSDVDFLAAAPAAGAVISSGSTIDGRITSPSTISVSGLVQGELNASEIVVEKEGSVNGSIFAEHLIIIGNLEGEVSANKITIASTGSVKGDLSYKRLAIDDGAILDVNFHKI